ncbi:putative F-box protein At1g67623 [Durio zibethinus]|uniref:F-box protein At1g67623 n=1 Tax=Durio zibethinus TaxID=66656 RepID=A0A6P5ZW27_DURZI|nr:putative F-box protein At1g67623 [Durio zibethinus]
MKNKTNNIVGSLPKEMLSEILMHAASNSVNDFVNVKLSCKAFLEASNYDHIFENVSMKKLSFVPWRKSEKHFLKRCKDARNAEALYRKGMVNYFSRRNAESGLRYLKKAVEKGHVEAIYTYGIILICLGGELRKQGLQALSSSNLMTSCSKRSFKIASCRSKTKKFLSSMWVYVSLDEPKEYCVNNAKVVCCNCDDHDVAPRPNCLSSEGQSWEASNNLVDNLPCCDSCFWNREAALFCSILRKFLVN